MTWKGVIIEESLSDKELLQLVRVVKTKKTFLEGEKEAGTLTFHCIEVDDDKQEMFVKKAMSSIKERWYLHIVEDGTMIVVYQDKSFEFRKNETEKLRQAEHYGMSMGIREEQIDFEHTIDHPFD